MIDKILMSKVSMESKRIKPNPNSNDKYMTKVDLSDYSIGELKGLQLDTEKEIKNRQHQEHGKAREQILAIAKGMGILVDELLADGGAKSKNLGGKKVQAQYQNPDNNAQTWTGRGRQPRWIVDGLANGKTLEDFRI